jgi:hypothetical protein
MLCYLPIPEGLSKSFEYKGVTFALDRGTSRPRWDGHASGCISYTTGQTKIQLTGVVLTGMMFISPGVEVRLDGRFFGSFTDTHQIKEARLRSAVEFALEAVVEEARLQALAHDQALSESLRRL